MIVSPQPSCHNRLKSLNSFSVSLLEELTENVVDVLWRSFEGTNRRPSEVFIRGVLGNLPIPPVNPFSIYFSIKDLTTSIARRPKLKHVGFLLEMRKTIEKGNEAPYPAAEMVPFGPPYAVESGLVWTSNAFADPYQRLFETVSPELVQTMVGQRRYCLSPTEQGLCRNLAGAGTSHVGIRPCSEHDRVI